LRVVDNIILQNSLTEDKDFPSIKDDVSFPPIKAGATTIDILSIVVALKKIAFP
jgi:hypothetical protein